MDQWITYRRHGNICDISGNTMNVFEIDRAGVIISYFIGINVWRKKSLKLDPHH